MEKAAKAGDTNELTRLQQLSDDLGNTYQTGHPGQSLGRLKQLMQEKGLCQPYTMPPL